MDTHRKSDAVEESLQIKSQAPNRAWRKEIL